MKKQKNKSQFLAMVLTLFLTATIDAQVYRADFPESTKDEWTSRANWSWSLDDDNDESNGEGFRWWNNGGNKFSDLFMQLRVLNWNNISLEIPTATANAVFSLMANDHRSSADEEGVYPYIFLQTGDARNAIFYGKDNYLNFSVNPKAPTNHSFFPYSKGFRFIDSDGADITNNPESYGNELMRIQNTGQVGIGTPSPLATLHVKGDFRVQSASETANAGGYFTVNTDNGTVALTSNSDTQGMVLSSKTGNKMTLGDGNDELLLNGHKITLDCNAVALTQVSVNTNKHVDNTVLTVAGATYIGPKAELAAEGALSKFNARYLSSYNLWVETGIVSEDFAFANVKAWRDDVFNPDYELMPLEEVKTHIRQNKHLPNVPSEQDIKAKGYTAHQMNMIFMQKIEELTLYTISLNEKIKELEDELTRYKN